jgi:hypothetical protein
MTNIFTHSFSRGSSFPVSVSRCAPSAKFSSPARCARLSAAPVRPGAGRRRPAPPGPVSQLRPSAPALVGAAPASATPGAPASPAPAPAAPSPPRPAPPRAPRPRPSRAPPLLRASPRVPRGLLRPAPRLHGAPPRRAHHRRAAPRRRGVDRGWVTRQDLWHCRRRALCRAPARRPWGWGRAGRAALLLRARARRHRPGRRERR